MAVVAEFEPLRTETIDTIRARIDTNVNAGLDPADPRWQETVGGGFFHDHTQAFGLEAELLWDYASTELVASFFLQFSWGIYLDYWGQMLDLPRKDPATAVGGITITNDGTEDAELGAGVNVQVPASDPSLEPLTYLTDTTVTIPAGGEVDVTVTAEQPGSAYNVAQNAITTLEDPTEGLSVTNDAAITGGADEELDEPYKDRLLLEFSGSRGGGTIDDYVSLFLTQPEVGHVTIQPHFAGPGTVRAILSDVDNQPLAVPVLDRIQAWVDPVPANGEGEAPIDAAVTVATVTLVNATVAAAIAPETGFSVGGSGGTEAVGAAVEAALVRYFHSLGAGDDVLHNRVLGIIMGVTGVYDVTGLTLNGVAGDLAVAPLESAHLVTPVTLT